MSSKIERYSQRDSKWANQKLGYGNTRIHDFGCVITALAQLLLLNGHEETPTTVNDKLKANKGFVGDNKNLIVWSAIAEAFKAKHIKRSWTYNNTEVAAAIEKYGGCLVEVDGKRIGAPTHWVLYIGNQRMIDPWTGREKSTSYYPAKGYSIISVEKVEKPTPAPKPVEFDVEADLSSQIEEDAGLKGYRWYDKHWSFMGLVNFTDTLDRENENLRSQLVEAQNMAKTETKTLTEHIGSGAKYAGSSVTVGGAVAILTAAFVPQVRENPEAIAAIQSLVTFAVNLLMIGVFKNS